MLDPATLDVGTSYLIEGLPGRWRPSWSDHSEIVFTGDAGKLLIEVDRLIPVGPNHLQFVPRSPRRH